MEVINVAIADANIFLREGLKRILGAQGDLLVVGEAGDNVAVAAIVERTQPGVLLLDLELPTEKAVPILLELKRKNVPTKVLIFAPFPDPESILDTAKAGARGYALKSILPSPLAQAIRTIHRGEIWVDRQLDCADTFVELARQTCAADADRLENELTEVLSRRELEILALVATGQRNAEIGKKLFISLQTVKIHLNHVFDKLNVKNRTQAALLFAGYKIRDANQKTSDSRYPLSRSPNHPLASAFPSLHRSQTQMSRASKTKRLAT
jgi:DNA-binding NarL/FixJ family response regulator